MGYMATDLWPLPFRDTESKWSGPDEQPPAASVRCEGSNITSCEKIVRFFTRRGESDMFCPRMSLNPLAVFFFPRQCYTVREAPPDTGSPRLSPKERRVRRKPLSHYLYAALYCTSDISALVKGCLRNRLCRKGSAWGTRMLADF